MKLNLKVLIAGLAIIVATNVVALTGVAFNRSGEPEAVIELTERELRLPYNYRSKENTGLALQLNCRTETTGRYYARGYQGCRNNLEWLDKERLAELGFEFDRQESGYNFEDRYLPRRIFVVLENNSPVHQRLLTASEKDLEKEKVLLASNPDSKEIIDRVEELQDYIQRERESGSRLFLIDAGIDKDILRNTYPDNSQYIIVRASVRPVWDSRVKKEWTGRITEILTDSIHIPLEHRAVLEPLRDSDYRRDRDDIKPRYKVRVAFGKRGEPWVLGVEGL